MQEEKHKPSPPTRFTREEFAELLAKMVAEQMPKPQVHSCVFSPEVSELLVELAREYKSNKETRNIVRGIIQSTVIAGACTGVLYAIWEGIKVLLHK